jgi:2'-5' RNA ligase
VLVIFSKLDIPTCDRAWIDAIRRQHDPQEQMVEPHFTFVFPFEGLSSGEVFAHAQAVASEASPIPFRLSQAAAVRDLFGPGGHLFLLPNEGAPEMRALHRQLYSGVLAPKLHPTATYAPHVTVGAFARHEDAEHAAEHLHSLEIRGMLDAILIAEFEGTSVRELHQLPLGPR